MFYYLSRERKGVVAVPSLSFTLFLCEIFFSFFLPPNVPPTPWWSPPSSAPSTPLFILFLHLLASSTPGPRPVSGVRQSLEAQKCSVGLLRWWHHPPPVPGSKLLLKSSKCEWSELPVTLPLTSNFFDLVYFQVDPCNEALWKHSYCCCCATKVSLIVFFCTFHYPVPSA